MKPTSLITLCLALSAIGLRAEDKPLLAVPGAVIYESKLDAAPGAPWKAAKGKWELVEGALRGSELEADKHGAVTRLPNKLQDFVIEYEFKFEGARTTSLSINAVKDHMARISITPKSVAIQKDDNDHEGPDKAVVFARFPTELAHGTWHKVRLEI
jgi:outer membrane scaffolding protein for murein synthesis (MipA/OmpV family)